MEQPHYFLKKEVTSQEKASALMLVMWAILFFSVAVLGMVEFVQFDADEQIARSQTFRAQQLAESGLAIALHPNVEYPDPLLKQTFAKNTESFEVTILSEGAFINLNQILASEDLGILERLFTSWGLDATQLREVLDSMLDWIDPDELRRLNGAERDYYFRIGMKNTPPNRPFRTLDEVEQVHGMEIIRELKPDWQHFFTLWSSGRIDVNSADREVLIAATGAFPELVDALIERRLGEDGERGTEDDYRFESIDSALAILQVPVGFSQQAAAVLSVDDDIKRIESLGTAGNYRRMIKVVANRKQQGTVFLKWLEE